MQQPDPSAIILRSPLATGAAARLAGAAGALAALWVVVLWVIAA